MNTTRLVCALLTAISIAAGQGPSPRWFDVRDFGAVGDGTTLDTKALQEAIDRCALHGGTVVFSPGVYLTGSLELRSNVELQVQSGATVLGSTNLADYAEHVPKLKSYNDTFLKHSLFYAEGKSNISISGKGVIDGQGGSFPVATNEKPAKYRNRPFVIRFVECTGVSVEGITLRSSAMWMQQYLACEDLRIRGITVFNHANKNNDMMDIDGCRNVVISDCIGDTDDDGITLKSTSERPTEHVTISNCVISSHCNALKTGTESTGGFRDIAVSNLVIKPSKVDSVMSGKRGGISGISLTLVDGGIMDGVCISNVVIDGPEVPLFLRLGNRARKHREDSPQPGIGSMKDVSISHVTALNVGRTGCSVTGIPGHRIQGVSLTDIRMIFTGGAETLPKESPEELEDQYPEATMFRLLPSYGMYFRHVDGLRIQGLTLASDREDVRPPIVVNDVLGTRMNNLDVRASGSAGAAIVLENTEGLSVTGSVVRGEVASLFRFIGNKNKDISVFGNDLRGVQRISGPAEGVDLYESGNRIGR